MNAFDTADHQFLIHWFLLACSFFQRFETREYSSGLSGTSAAWILLVYFWSLLQHLQWFSCFTLSLFAFGAFRAMWCWQILACAKKVLSQREPPQHSVGLQRSGTAVQSRRKGHLHFNSTVWLILSLLACTSTCSIWPRRFFVRSRMTGRWTGGVWELCSMRWSSASYVFTS